MVLSVSSTTSLLLFVGQLLYHSVCGNVVERALQETIVDVIMNQSDLSLIANVFNSSKNAIPLLEGPGPLTVFPPLNTALLKVDSNLLTKLQKPEYVKHLENLLLFHLYNETVLSSDLVTGDQNITMMNNEIITVTKADTGNVTLSFPFNYTGTVTVNVTIPDLEASNGAVHAIDGVLLPKYIYTPFVLLAPQAPEISSMYELLQVAFPDGLPADYGDLTVFAPSNEAFEKLDENLLAELKQDTSKLLGILVNHVVQGVVPSTFVVDGGNLTTLGTQKLNLTVENDKKYVNGAEIVVPDILASDGIVHVIDSVLLFDAPSSTGTPTATPTPDSTPVPAPTPTMPSPETSSASSIMYLFTNVVCMGFAVTSFL